VNLNFILAVLNRATEESFHHVWHEIRAANHNALQGDEVLYVRWVHAAHDLVFLLQEVIDLYLAIAEILWLIGQLPHGNVPELTIEDRDDLGRKAYKIVVQPFGILCNVSTFDRELDAFPVISLLLPAFVELLQVQRPLLPRSICLAVVPDEAMKVPHNTSLTDISTIQEVALVHGLISIWG